MPSGIGAHPNVGQLHIVYGRVTYSSGTPTLTSNDGSASVADTGTGNAIVTFGQAFLSAPQIMCSALKGTHSATTQNSVTCEQATTTTAEFRWMEATGTATHPAVLTGSTTWDPGSIADGNEEAQAVTVTGAALGDVALASHTIDVADLTISAAVTATDTATVVLANNTGGAIDIATGTVAVVTWTPAAAAVAVASTSPDPADDEAFMFVAFGLRDR